MSEQLTHLRSEAKKSMESMVSKALLQDATSDYKRNLFRLGYRWVTLGLLFVSFTTIAYKLPEVDSVKNHFTNGPANVFLFGTRSIRERSDPGTYEKDQLYRRQETQLFR
jgi:hypothetical protein